MDCIRNFLYRFGALEENKRQMKGRHGKASRCLHVMQSMPAPGLTELKHFALGLAGMIRVKRSEQSIDETLYC